MVQSIFRNQVPNRELSEKQVDFQVDWMKCEYNIEHKQDTMDF